MAKQDTSRFPRQGRATSAVVSGGRDNKTGRETWHITENGEQRTLTTSASSVAMIEEATEVFSEALKRLAKK